MVPGHVFPDQFCLENKMFPPSSSFHLGLLGAAKSQKMVLWGRPQSGARTCQVSGPHASPWELTHIHWHSAHQFPEGLFISVSTACRWVAEGPCHPAICLLDPGTLLRKWAVPGLAGQPSCSWSHQGREERGGNGCILGTFHMPGTSPWVIFTPALQGRVDSPIY